MQELSLQLEELNYRMTGSGCVPISRVSPTVSPSVRSNLGLIEKKDKLLEEYRTHARMAENAHSGLELISEEDRNLLTDKYIDRMPSIQIEDKYGYTRSTINRMCNKIIRRIVFYKK